MSMIDELKSRVGSTIRPTKFHLHPTVKHSPVPRLFACNDPPSESERLLILHTVENREKEIQDIDRRMKLSEWSCGSSAGQWATKKSIREEFIRLHKLLLSPIRVLPTEICNLCFTIRSWRAIVLSMSQLWDAITIDFSQPRSTLLASLKYLQIMLGRSSEQLLRISLISGPTSSSAVFEALADVMPACERWEEFAISAPYDVMAALDQITTNGLPETLIQDLKLLLKRSTSTRVKKLHLLVTPSGAVPPGSITELLELCPEVIDLELPLPPRKDLSNLILGQNPIHLVPGLRYLTFHNDVFEWNPGVTQRLAAIASSRCEPRTPPASPSCPSRHLRFPTEDACLDAFAVLHDVRVGYGRIYSEDVNETFCKVLNTLDAPCEENWVLKGLQNVKAAATKLTPIFTQRLSYVIEFSEDAEYESIETLYLNDSAIPGNQEHKFKERGLQALQQWCKILLEDAPNCKWGFEPPSSLVYVPTGDPIRQSKLQSLKMFFGLDMASESLQCLISGED
ncbi:hypothetical protein NLJ89_g1296 [Agrocybe chaxingu]|uniref:Uncharacterized protein n=1 Tax=Agrocybe chaxingu TaxID=84603 RepID=A0A9W8N0B5_9AGAR|nr:hypothetical protein NLJ89_g1296 [Agrocybe chaxingu]